MERAQRRSQQEDGLLDRLRMVDAQQTAAATPMAPSEVIYVAPPSNVPPAERICVCCCEPGESFIRPCICQNDYCQDCLTDRFIMAVQDRTMFPARCCSLLQLHTALPKLSDEHANKYRLQFQEYISPTKTFCPSPSCSRFISDCTLEKIKRTTAPTTFREFVSKVISKMTDSPSARFFREELNVTLLPGHTVLPADSIHLADMKAKIDRYTSVEELTQDLQLILSNTYLHGLHHPIAHAAEELLALCLHEISDFIKERLCDQDSFFACPTCQTSICIKCKQTAHQGNACDTTSREQELAMLKKFGYKQCPRCGHGVRKMYGCSHIMCRCGASFCWQCVKSIDLCLGGCGIDEDEDDEGEEEGEEEEGGGEDDEIVEDEAGGSGTRVQISGSDTMPTEPPNLDTGGDRRWQGQDLDFGDEPDEDDASHQMWSCRHTFRKWRETKDGFFHGLSSLIECNRCFKGCPGGKGASMCASCSLLVCAGCKESLKSSGANN